MKLNPLKNQVGGHDGVMSMGDDNEIIVKPSLPQELEFYEESVLHPELAAWMPAYYGSLTLTRNNTQAMEVATAVMDGDSSVTTTVISETTTTVAIASDMPTIKALNGYALSALMPDQEDSGADVATQEKSDLDDECVCLENISHGFHKACVLDLKLGTQLYDDNASDEKKARLDAVSQRTTSIKFGFRMTGFQVYDSSNEDYIKYSKDYGKGLTEETVMDGFRNFFSAKLGPKRMRLVVERFVNDLTDFLATIECQELRMRSSSLLMLYEGDAEAFDEGLLIEQGKIAAVIEKAEAYQARQQQKYEERKAAGKEDEESEEEEESDDEDDDEEEEEGQSQKVTDMRLIDFAHSTWTPGMGPDEGVVLGVKSALEFFERLLKEDYPEEEEA